MSKKNKLPNIDFQEVYDALMNNRNDELKNFGLLMSKSSTFAHKAHKEFSKINGNE